MGFSIRPSYLILIFTVFISFFLFFAGLLIAANPYLALKVYPKIKIVARLLCNTYG